MKPSVFADDQNTLPQLYFQRPSGCKKLKHNNNRGLYQKTLIIIYCVSSLMIILVSCSSMCGLECSLQPSYDHHHALTGTLRRSLHLPVSYSCVLGDLAGLFVKAVPHLTVQTSKVKSSPLLKATLVKQHWSNYSARQYEFVKRAQSIPRTTSKHLNLRFA